MEKDSSINEWYWETGHLTSKRMKLSHFLIPYTKINSEWIKDLKCNTVCPKLLEESRGRTLLA